MATADLDGDGKLDVVTANNDINSNGKVSVLLGQGNGLFALAVTYFAGPDPYGVAAADLNGDGKPDLAVANSYSNTVSVLLNPGNGTFDNKVSYPRV